MNNVRSMMDKIMELRQQRAILMLFSATLLVLLIISILSNESPRLRSELQAKNDIIKMKDEVFIRLVDKIRSESRRGAR